jgi:hypothetical protein
VKQVITKMFFSRYFPLVVVSAFYVYFFLSVKGRFADDVVFYDIAQNCYLFDYLKANYANWSARLLIEGLIICLFRVDFFVWQILTGLCFVVFLWTLYYLFFTKAKLFVIWIFCSFIMLIHWPVLCCSSGWIATTLNYLWPMTAMFVSFIPLKMISNGKASWDNRYLFFVPVILFAANAEIFCLILLFISAGFCLRKRVGYYYLLFFLSLGSLLYILSCPGIANRFSAEVVNWFPNFNELSLVQKAVLGIMNMFNYMLIRNRFVFMFLSLLVFMTVFKETKNIWYKIISFVPFAAALSLGFLRNMIIRFFPAFQNLFVDGRFGGFPKMEEQYCTFQQGLVIVFIVIILVCYLLSIYVIFRHTKQIFLLYSIILAGFLSQFVLSFSPTVFVSEIRTAILLFTTLAIVGAMVFSYSVDHLKINKLERFTIVAIFVAAVLYQQLTGVL